jgi:large subunit ribosomal protein L1
VTFEVAKVIKEIKAGKIEFRVEKSGVVHAPVGRVSLGAEKLLQNIASFMDTIVRLKPASSKGIYLKSIAVSTTMGPGIKIDPAHVKGLLS